MLLVLEFWFRVRVLLAPPDLLSMMKWPKTAIGYRVKGAGVRAQGSGCSGDTGHQVSLRAANPETKSG